MSNNKKVPSNGHQFPHSIPMEGRAYLSPTLSPVLFHLNTPEDTALPPLLKLDEKLNGFVISAVSAANNNSTNNNTSINNNLASTQSSLFTDNSNGNTVSSASTTINSSNMPSVTTSLSKLTEVTRGRGRQRSLSNTSAGNGETPLSILARTSTSPIRLAAAASTSPIRVPLTPNDNISTVSTNNGGTTLNNPSNITNNSIYNRKMFTSSEYIGLNGATSLIQKAIALSNANLHQQAYAKALNNTTTTDTELQNLTDILANALNIEERKNNSNNLRKKKTKRKVNRRKNNETKTNLNNNATDKNMSDVICFEKQSMGIISEKIPVQFNNTIIENDKVENVINNEEEADQENANTSLVEKFLDEEQRTIFLHNNNTDINDNNLRNNDAVPSSFTEMISENGFTISNDTSTNKSARSKEKKRYSHISTLSSATAVPPQNETWDDSQQQQKQTHVLVNNGNYDVAYSNSTWSELHQHEMELRMKEMELHIQELRLTNEQLRYAIQDHRLIQDKLIYEALHETLRSKEYLQTNMEKKMKALENKIEKYKLVINKLSSNGDEPKLSQGTKTANIESNETGVFRFSRINSAQLEDLVKSNSEDETEGNEQGGKGYNLITESLDEPNLVEIASSPQKEKSPVLQDISNKILQSPKKSPNKKINKKSRSGYKLNLHIKLED
ncbi:Mmr1p SCDLUD_000210 [Saccharomycodes ludwigii]|uniref:Mmr1p n=1 Tax=Saccharomycodes ludwigii TaxID=36035 RepID=UPI001E8C913F|nr:hypothetical protein SCDLUD_000210 [Saccharomycodes ludwigii]KAH3902629.1 hypothetical protein SCDLUD_000210 [Saccharomycodes ludwigii]